ncbi:ATP-binding protein [Dactylosporangium sp. NPDC049140]|jgi:serine/threonine-protein kinase RsbW|uniref:ATP-binding protein n=1 Tax=Dactylosporangium sp. NPDC049140 TaxID=3155647 RepID=UPI0033CA0E50
MNLTLTVHLPPELSSVARARDLLDAMLALAEAGEHCRSHLAIVITEACANAVLHGDVSAMVELAIVIDLDACAIEVGNRGRTPRIGRLAAIPPDPRRIHGRGLPLIAALTDTAAFVEIADGRVLLRMTRRLGQFTPSSSA